MDPTISSYSFGSSAIAAESALQPLLDAFAQQEHSSDDLTMGLTSVCAQHPSATWQALSLLDQYHRRRVLTTELFVEIKKQLNAIAFGTAGAHVDVEGQTYARSRARRSQRTANLGNAATAQRSADSTAQHTSARDITASHTAALRTSGFRTEGFRTEGFRTEVFQTESPRHPADRTAARADRTQTPSPSERTETAALRTAAREITKERRARTGSSPLETSALDYSQLALPTPEPASNFLDREMALDAEMGASEEEFMPAGVDPSYDEHAPITAFADDSPNSGRLSEESRFLEPSPLEQRVVEPATIEPPIDTSSLEPASLTSTPIDFEQPAYIEADFTASRMPFADSAEEPRHPTMSRTARAEPVEIEQMRLVRSRTQRAGTVLNERYMLVEPVVSGSISTIFKALDYQRSALPESDRYVAIKCPQEALQGDPRAAAALQYEYSQAQAISHPNIAKVYDYYADDSQCYIVMELLQGESLDWILERIAPRRLPIRRALAIIREIGNAVAHAHDRGVMHGNLHTGSVTITRTGELRVADFGQAVAWQGAGAGVQAADDLYHLARIAHELLCGCGPEYGAINKRDKSDNERPHYAKHLNARQWRALQRGLSDTRLQRPNKVREWLSELDLSTAEIRLPALAILEAETADKGRLRRDIAWLAAGIVGAAAIGLGGWALLSNDGTLSARPAEQIESTAADATATSNAIEATSDESTVPETGSLAAYTDRLASSGSLQSNPQSATAARDAWEQASTSIPATALESAAAGLPVVTFSANRYEISETQPAARLVIQRSGPANRELVLRWYTIPDTAQPDRDYVSTERETVRLPAGQQSAEILIPIVKGQRRDRAISFNVRIGATSQALPGRSVATKVVLLPAMSGGN